MAAAAPLAATSAGQEKQLPLAERIVAELNDRDMGDSARQRMEMALRDKEGRERVREMLILRKRYDDVTRTAIFFTAPANIEGTALLTYDYHDSAKNDDQWLYLPALRKVRRIPASDRSDPFLGSDFTYRDMSSESRANLKEHEWRTLRLDEVDGNRVYVIEALPANKRLEEELGYAKAELWVDADRPVMVMTELYEEGQDDPYRRVFLRDYKEIDGILAPFYYEARDLGSGHSTVINVTDADFNVDVPEHVFSIRGLERGL
jgi:hypothetical protein